MDATAAAVTGAVAFLWLGMVLAISFVETPLKFRAPGMTIPLGVGVGRLVFRALNRIETVLAVVVVVAVGAGGAAAVTAVTVFAAVVVLLLTVQLGVVRPRLNRRSDRILAGQELPLSRGHLHYVALEAVKAVALLGLGVSALAA